MTPGTILLVICTLIVASGIALMATFGLSVPLHLALWVILSIALGLVIGPRLRSP